MNINLDRSEFAIGSGNPGYISNVAGQSGGRFFVAWQTFTNVGEYDTNILGQSFDLAGPLSTGITINSVTRDIQYSPSVAALAGGGYVVAYGSGSDNHFGGTYLTTQIIDREGAKIDKEIFSPRGYWSDDPVVAALPDGGYVVVSNGGYVVVSSGEDGIGNAEVRLDKGTRVERFDFGSYDFTARSNSVVELRDGKFALFWAGFETSDRGEPSVGTAGLYVQIHTPRAVSDQLESSGVLGAAQM